MAETLGFGASILAFIAVADKLSSATATQYPSISDAPSVARGVRTQLGELGMILFHIDHTRSKSPECVGDPAVESYWTGKQAKLRSDFARFENFAAQLAENTGKARIKKKWSLSLEGRLKKVQYLLAKDIEVLRALLEIMESCTLEKIYPAHAPVITTLARASRILDDVNAARVTKQQSEYYGTLRLIHKTTHDMLESSVMSSDDPPHELAVSRPMRGNNSYNEYFASSDTVPGPLPRGRESGGRRREGGGSQESVQDALVPGVAGHRKAGEGRIWNTSTNEERARIKDFWFSLGEADRRSLVKLEKEEVLREMKEQEQQNNPCSCSVCGRQRTAIREELEILYEELEQSAGQQQNSKYATQVLHSPPPPPPPPPGHHLHLHHGNHNRRPRVEEVGGESSEDEERDEGDVLAGTLSEHDTRPNFFNFGNSLTGQGGILTDADDLMKNDGKGFLEMMEQLAERRMQREEEEEEEEGVVENATTGRLAGVSVPHLDAQRNAQTGQYGSEDEDEEDEEDDEEFDDDEEDEPDTMTEEQRMEEGRRMFRIFAARMFEQRVWMAYQEKGARERQEKPPQGSGEEAGLRSQSKEKNSPGEGAERGTTRLEKLTKVEGHLQALSNSGGEADDGSDCESIVSQLESIFDQYGSESSASSIGQGHVEEQAVHAIASVLANNTDVSAIIAKGMDKLSQGKVDKLMTMALRQFSNDLKQRLDNGKPPLGVKIKCLRFLEQNAVRIARKLRELTQSNPDVSSVNYTALKKHLEEMRLPIGWDIERWRGAKPGHPGEEGLETGAGEEEEGEEEEEEDFEGDEEHGASNEITPDERVSLGGELLKQLSEFLASGEASSHFVRAVKDKFIKGNIRRGLGGDGSLGSLGHSGTHSIETLERNDELKAGSDNQMSGYGNTAKVTHQVCVDQWPALFADGKTDIHFDDEDTWSFSNEIKGLIEDFIAAPVDWWPLSARRRPLQDGFSRVRWKCRCGRGMSDIMSTARRDRYERWLSASSSGLLAQDGRPSYMGQRNPGPTATGGGPSDTSLIPPSSSQSTPANQGGSPGLPPPQNLDGVGRGRGQAPSGLSPPPQERQTPTTPGLYLFWCMPSGLDQTVVRSIPVAGDDTDERVFHNLRSMYYQTRGLWRVVSFHAVRELRYVKFSNFQHDRVSCYRKQELPEPTNPDYEYRFPGDCDSDIPPIPVDQLVESFRNPSCAGEVRTALESFAKKKSDKTNRIAWGLYACEQISFFRVLIFLVSGLVATLSFVPYWLLDHPGDLQNAFVPAAFFVTLAGLCIGVSVMCTDAGAR